MIEVNERKNDRKRGPEPPSKNCTNCRYSGDVAGQLACRFKPPAAVMMMGVNPVTGQPTQGSGSLWPPVTQFDWCGSYAVKLENVN